jgi:hypothetical protein
MITQTKRNDGYNRIIFLLEENGLSIKFSVIGNYADQFDCSLIEGFNPQTSVFSVPKLKVCATLIEGDLSLIVSRGWLQAENPEGVRYEFCVWEAPFRLGELLTAIRIDKSTPLSVLGGKIKKVSGLYGHKRRVTLQDGQSFLGEVMASVPEMVAAGVMECRNPELYQELIDAVKSIEEAEKKYKDLLEKHGGELHFPNYAEDDEGFYTVPGIPGEWEMPNLKCRHW